MRVLFLLPETRVASTKIPPDSSSQNFVNEPDSHTFLFAMTVCSVIILQPVPYRSKISLTFRSTPSCLSRLVVMLLPRIRTAFTTPRKNERRAEEKCLNSSASNASFIRFITFLSGRIPSPHIQVMDPHPQTRDADIMNIESRISSTQSAPRHISKTARLDSSPNIILSLAKSSGIQIWFEPIFTLSIS